jgi:hypothetical protein
MERLRWNGNVVSPFDATSTVYKCAGPLVAYDVAGDKISDKVTGWAADIGVFL